MKKSSTDIACLTLPENIPFILNIYLQFKYACNITCMHTSEVTDPLVALLYTHLGALG